MGTCSEVSVQAVEMGCLDADFRRHDRPADTDLTREMETDRRRLEQIAACAGIQASPL